MSTDFIKDFNNALNNITPNQLRLMEKAVDYFSTSASSKDSYLNFQIQMLNILGDKFTPVVLHFIKNNEPFTPDKKQRAVYATLTNYKLLTQFKIMNIEQSISTPLKLSGNLFSYSEDFPNHLTSTFFRADGENFVVQMTINDAFTLMFHMIENFDTKFTQGSNTLDIQLYQEFNKSLKKIDEKIQELFEKSVELAKVDENNNGLN